MLRISGTPAPPVINVVHADITVLDIDAVVNAANERMLGGGGVDGAIHQAAGPRLLAACRAIPEVRPGVRCPTGEARITPGFGLPARHVVHTVGPVWRGGAAGEADLLASAYRSSLALAAEHGLGTVAFPVLSTGVYGYPADAAARVAVETVRAWQAEHDRPARVLLVGFDAGGAETLRRALDDHPAPPRSNSGGVGGALDSPAPLSVGGRSRIRRRPRAPGP